MRCIINVLTRFCVKYIFMEIFFSCFLSVSKDFWCSFSGSFFNVGRVVVRLERLMGSDRIRITDPKYLSTLVERLEAEEDKSWGSRSRLRKKAEKNRSRQLAIEGLMEPAEDMLDLYEHPVFRYFLKVTTLV